ncbi:MAG: hypothetical protein Q8L49_05830 [Burkholderiaceae bacterium]|nr:hypothetical protein [Burkholderiaceae bacterium]
MQRRFPLTALFLLLSMGGANAADTPSEAPPAPAEAELSRSASAAARAAWGQRDVASMLALVQSMKALACARDEPAVCKNLASFEAGAAPRLAPGKTLMLGLASLGTFVPGESYGACVFNNEAGKILSTCFRFGAANDSQRREVEAALAQVQLGPVDAKATVLRFLCAQLPDALPVAAGEAGADTLVAYRTEGDSDRPPLPTVIRQQGDTLYAASIGFLDKLPGSFDRYPTLMLSTLKILK